MDTQQLQDAWDQALLAGWHKAGRMGTLAWYFCQEQNLLAAMAGEPHPLPLAADGGPDFQALMAAIPERMPQAFYPGKMPVRAWVHEVLPRLSHRLWADRYTDEELLAFMKTQATAKEARGLSEKQALRIKSNADVHKDIYAKNAAKKHWKRNQWETTK